MILFLDFDGVLHPVRPVGLGLKAYWQNACERFSASAIGQNESFCPICGKQTTDSRGFAAHCRA